MVHLFFWRSLGSDWRPFPTSEWTLATLVHILQNLVHHSQNLVHPLKNWYIQSLSYWDPYLITHALFIPLRIFENWLEVVPNLETDFGTLGTFLRKFDTSNSWAIRTSISLPMVHFFIWRPLGSDWRSFPTSEQTLALLVHHLQNLVYHSQKMVYPIIELLQPLFYYPWSVYSFRDIWEVIGGRSLF